MPLYEYQCDACAHRFEVIQKFSDPPIETCPACGSPVHKLLSSPAIQFKGSGWYITDYARAGKSEASAASGKSGTTKTDGATGGAGASGEAGGSAKADTKSETKPASPAPSASKPD